MSAILIISVCVLAAIGAVVGFFKKFTKTSFWGLSVAIALLFERMIGTSMKKGDGGYGWAVILTAVIVLLVITAVFISLKKLLANAVAARKKLSEYKNYDERAERDELILNAVDNNDKREYKRQLKKKKKIKDSAGIWGILDGVFGAVSGCLNLLAGVGAIIVFLLMFVDLSGISALQNVFSSALDSSGWQSFGKIIALDLIIVCGISFGIQAGLSSAISGVIVLGLAVGFGYASWSIASSAVCADAVEKLKSGALSSISSMGGVADIAAKAIIAAIIFALSLIIIILVAVFLPKILDKFSENKVFCVVDSVLGAIIVCVVITALFMAVGGIAATLSDLSFMEKFNEYAKGACIGDGMYLYNPLASSFKSFPLRKLFGE